jgi:hypothetical protein
MHRTIHLTRLTSRRFPLTRTLTLTLAPTPTRHASSTPTPLSPLNPTTTTSLSALERGNLLLEQGDVDAAREEYRKSLEVERNAGAAFNLGVSGDGGVQEMGRDGTLRWGRRFVFWFFGFWFFGDGVGRVR